MYMVGMTDKCSRRREKLARPGETTNCVSGTMDEAKVGGASALEKGRDIVPPWDSLPSEALENFLQRLDFEDLFRCKAVCKTFKAIIETDGFLESRGDGREGFFTAISYFLNNNAWRWCGFDVESNSWRSLPTFSSCPLRPDRFSKSSVSGHRSLMCGHVSEGRLKGKVVVFNPLTGRTRVLPPLLHSRIPVMVHFSVDSGGDSYTVVAAGSTSKNNWHNLQGKVEVFCSTTSKWTEAGEVPESTLHSTTAQVL